MVDVLIIGSGPIGATFARMISDQRPDAKIMMIDLGPRLTAQSGQHVKNINNPKARIQAQIQSQGPRQVPYPNISVAQRALAVQHGTLNADILARAGTHLVADDPEELEQSQMPAASMSSNLGGMGVHWTCACPRPGNEERIAFIPEEGYERAFAKAEELLCVTQDAFPATPEGNAILNTLGDVFNKRLSSDRQVQPMPLACKVNNRGERYWVASDVILGPMAAPNYEGNLEIRSETICRQLLRKGDTIAGAMIEYLPAGRQEEIRAKVVIVAADALRTPQLLWASGIRPPALGHYLNEHPFIFSFVELNEALVDRNSAHTYDPVSRAEPTIGVFWVPFDAPHHPYHGQIMHLDLSPLKTNTYNNPKHIVGLGWGCRKEVQFEDCIVFSETEKDYFGMPKMDFKFSYTEQDLRAIEGAKILQQQAAKAFGKIIKEGDQTLMPAGTSLHYEGTTRMGPVNDGASVCDTFSQVWGYKNLFVGGNGVIPNATTSNPTLTSVAMAVRASFEVCQLLE